MQEKLMIGIWIAQRFSSNTSMIPRFSPSKEKVEEDYLHDDH
jgi:hypothetical protein